LHCVVLVRDEVLAEEETDADASPMAEPVTPAPVAVVVMGYEVPSPSPMVCKGKPPAGWEVIVMGNWRVRASSKAGPEDAKRLLLKRARALNANGLLDVEYSRTELPERFGKGDEPAYAHHYHGRLAIVARKSPEGKLTRESLATAIDLEAELASERTARGSAAARQANSLLYAGCSVAALATGLLAGFNSLSMLLAGSAAIIVAAKLTKSTTVEGYLTFEPANDAGTVAPRSGF
jgi:hypothetical protein